MATDCFAGLKADITNDSAVANVIADIRAFLKGQFPVSTWSASGESLLKVVASDDFNTTIATYRKYLDGQLEDTSKFSKSQQHFLSRERTRVSLLADVSHMLREAPNMSKADLQALFDKTTLHIEKKTQFDKVFPVPVAKLWDAAKVDIQAWLDGTHYVEPTINFLLKDGTMKAFSLAEAKEILASQVNAPSTLVAPYLPYFAKSPGGGIDYAKYKGFATGGTQKGFIAWMTDKIATAELAGGVGKPGEGEVAVVKAAEVAAKVAASTSGTDFDKAVAAMKADDTLLKKPTAPGYHVIIHGDGTIDQYKPSGDLTTSYTKPSGQTVDSYKTAGWEVVPKVSAEPDVTWVSPSSQGFWKVHGDGSADYFNGLETTGHHYSSFDKTSWTLQGWAPQGEAAPVVPEVKPWVFPPGSSNGLKDYLESQGVQFKSPTPEVKQEIAMRLGTTWEDVKSTFINQAGGSPDWAGFLKEQFAKATADLPTFPSVLKDWLEQTTTYTSVANATEGVKLQVAKYLGFEDWKAVGNAFSQSPVVKWADWVQSVMPKPEPGLSEALQKYLAAKSATEASAFLSNEVKAELAKVTGYADWTALRYAYLVSDKSSYGAATGWNAWLKFVDGKLAAKVPEEEAGKVSPTLQAYLDNKALHTYGSTPLAVKAELAKYLGFQEWTDVHKAYATLWANTDPSEHAGIWDKFLLDHSPKPGMSADLKSYLASPIKPLSGTHDLSSEVKLELAKYLGYPDWSALLDDYGGAQSWKEWLDMKVASLTAVPFVKPVPYSDALTSYLKTSSTLGIPVVVKDEITALLGKGSWEEVKDAYQLSPQFLGSATTDWAGWLKGVLPPPAAGVAPAKYSKALEDYLKSVGSSIAADYGTLSQLKPELLAILGYPDWASMYADFHSELAAKPGGWGQWLKEALAAKAGVAEKPGLSADLQAYLDKKPTYPGQYDPSAAVKSQLAKAAGFDHWSAMMFDFGGSGPMGQIEQGLKGVTGSPLLWKDYLKAKLEAEPVALEHVKGITPELKYYLDHVAGATPGPGVGNVKYLEDVIEEIETKLGIDDWNSVIDEYEHSLGIDDWNSVIDEYEHSTTASWSDWLHKALAEAPEPKAPAVISAVLKDYLDTAPDSFYANPIPPGIKSEIMSILDPDGHLFGNAWSQVESDYTDYIDSHQSNGWHEWINDQIKASGATSGGPLPADVKDFILHQTGEFKGAEGTAIEKKVATALGFHTWPDLEDAYYNANGSGHFQAWLQDKADKIEAGQPVVNFSQSLKNYLDDAEQSGYYMPDASIQAELAKVTGVSWHDLAYGYDAQPDLSWFDFLQTKLPGPVSGLGPAVAAPVVPSTVFSQADKDLLTKMANGAVLSTAQGDAAAKLLGAVDHDQLVQEFSHGAVNVYDSLEWKTFVEGKVAAVEHPPAAVIMASGTTPGVEVHILPDGSSKYYKDGVEKTTLSWVADSSAGDTQASVVADYTSAGYKVVPAPVSAPSVSDVTMTHPDGSKIVVHFTGGTDGFGYYEHWDPGSSVATVTHYGTSQGAPSSVAYSKTSGWTEVAKPGADQAFTSTNPVNHGTTVVIKHGDGSVTSYGPNGSSHFPVVSAIQPMSLFPSYTLPAEVKEYTAGAWSTYATGTKLIQFPDGHMTLYGSDNSVLGTASVHSKIQQWTHDYIESGHFNLVSAPPPEGINGKADNLLASLIYKPGELPGTADVPSVTTDKVAQAYNPAYSWKNAYDVAYGKPFVAHADVYLKGIGLDASGASPKLKWALATSHAKGETDKFSYLAALLPSQGGAGQAATATLGHLSVTWEQLREVYSHFPGQYSQDATGHKILSNGVMTKGTGLEAIEALKSLGLSKKDVKELFGAKTSKGAVQKVLDSIFVPLNFKEQSLDLTSTVGHVSPGPSMPLTTGHPTVSQGLKDYVTGQGVPYASPEAWIKDGLLQVLSYPTWNELVTAAGASPIYSQQGWGGWLKDEFAKKGIVGLGAPAVPADPPVKTFKFHLDTSGAAKIDQGTHKVYILLDDFGARYLYKPDAEPFRTDTEHGAHALAKLFGFRINDSQIEVSENIKGIPDGLRGVVQRFAEAPEGSLGPDGKLVLPSTLSHAQIIDIAQSHVLDWAINNDDTHERNLLRLPDGHILGIDKGRAYKYLGRDILRRDKLDGNAHTYYTRLYDYAVQQAKKGDRSILDEMYFSAVQKARSMEKVSDDSMRPILSGMFAKRTNFSGTTATSRTQLVDQAIERKNGLVQDFEKFYAAVYKEAGLQVPDVVPEVASVRTGVTQEAVDAAYANKAHGAVAFFAGTDIEEQYVTMWPEVAVDKTTNFRGQMMVRKEADKRIMDWITAMNPTVVAGVPAPVVIPTLPKEQSWYDSLIGGAKTFSYHIKQGDTDYNVSKEAAFNTALADIKATIAKIDAGTLTAADLGLDPLADFEAYKKMLGTYSEYGDKINEAKGKAVQTAKDQFPQFKWVPTPKASAAAPPPPVAQPVSISYKNGTRAKGDYDHKTGQLILDGGVETKAQAKMYLVTLPDGSEIEYRPWQGTQFRSQQGLLRFTVHAHDGTLPAVQDVFNQLAVMGLPLESATDADMERFYWRHLSGVIQDRKLTSAAEKATRDAVKAVSWTSDDAELVAWRTAWAKLRGQAAVDEFVSQDGFLPGFEHFSIHGTPLPGKPYWTRFDISASDLESSQFLTATMRAEHVPLAVGSGGLLPTEERARVLGYMVMGDYGDPSTDMRNGAGSFSFLRQNNEGKPAQLYVNPRVLARTTTYANNHDAWGLIDERSTNSPWNVSDVMKINASGSQSGNEVTVKGGVSILDDIEVVTFDSQASRDQAITYLHENGIYEIRGMSVEERFVLKQDRQKAIKKAHDVLKVRGIQLSRKALVWA